MTERVLKITGRSSSHFTRVALIFAHELGLPFELGVVHDLSDTSAGNYGGNPALKVPSLHVGAVPLFGTENICRRLVQLAGRRGDPRIVLTEQLLDDLSRSAQELVWNAMATQVQLRVGLTVAKLPADNVFFEKAHASLAGSLAFLDGHLQDLSEALPSTRELSLLEVTLFCLFEHIVFRPTVPLDPYSNLRRFAAEFGLRPSAQRTPYHFDPV